MAWSGLKTMTGRRSTGTPGGERRLRRAGGALRGGGEAPAVLQVGGGDGGQRDGAGPDPACHVRGQQGVPVLRGGQRPAGQLAVLQADILLARAAVQPTAVEQEVRERGPSVVLRRDPVDGQEPSWAQVQASLLLDLAGCGLERVLAVLHAAARDLPRVAVGRLDEQDLPGVAVEDRPGAGDVLREARVVLLGWHMAHVPRGYPGPGSRAGDPGKQVRRTRSRRLTLAEDSRQALLAVLVSATAGGAPQVRVQGGPARAGPADRAGRVAGDQGIGGDIARDHGSDSDHGTRADGDAGCDDGTRANGRA